MQYIASLDMNNLGASFYNKREMETFDFFKIWIKAKKQAQKFSKSCESRF